MPCDYQLALADWEGRPAMEPTAWVPGIPLEMTVAAPASSNSLVVSSSGRQEPDNEYAVEVFKQAEESFQEKHDQMEMKIHLFPASMKDLADKYSIPNVVSIGPYHHGKTPALRQMESTKHVAAWYFIDVSRRSVDEVYGAVCEVADEARSHYDEDKLQALRVGDDDFKPMMFYDGCFLLQFMLYSVGGTVAPLLSDAFSSGGNGIYRDIVLLENQLPWVVVEKLVSFMPTPPDLVQFAGGMKISLQARQRLEGIVVWDNLYRPPHLLGRLWSCIVGSTHDTSSKPLTDKAKQLSTSVSAIELVEIGIKITATEAKEELKEMRVKESWWFSGRLLLAPLSLDYRNASFLVNMAALELCTTPNFTVDDDAEKSTVCSYLCLLGMVTDCEKDVEVLRNKSILEGGAGLDNKEALDLLNKLENDLRPGLKYMEIMLAIENYRNNRPIRIVLRKFFYKNLRIIIAVVSGIAGLAGFLGTLKSFQ